MYIARRTEGRVFTAYMKRTSPAKRKYVNLVVLVSHGAESHFAVFASGLSLTADSAAGTT